LRADMPMEPVAPSKAIFFLFIQGQYKIGFSKIGFSRGKGTLAGLEPVPA
jgi:hypothetical protein